MKEKEHILIDSDILFKMIQEQCHVINNDPTSTDFVPLTSGIPYEELKRVIYCAARETDLTYVRKIIEK